MQVSIVADELSSDPETAFELGLEMGIPRFELRGIYSDRLPRVSRHARMRLMRAIRDYDVQITAVSPGLFKFPLPADSPLYANLGWMDAGYFRTWENQCAELADHCGPLLDETIELAQSVGAGFLIGFSFHRAGAPGGAAPSRVVDLLGAAADRVRAGGLELLIESEEGFWGDTGVRCAALIRQIGAGRIGLNWDPANSLCEGDTPFPEGYDAVRSFVRNVHFKDAFRTADGAHGFVAEGQVDWQGQIAALHRDGYAGCIAIEPHLGRPVSAVRQAHDRLGRLMAAIRDAHS